MSGPSLLLHCCCAHCTASTVDHWRQKGFDVSGYWYNPNIHPYSEHQARLGAIQSLTERLSMPLVIADGYDVMEYFRHVAGDEAGRCRSCFQLRLNRTAVAARHLGAGAFSTSLLISPHQQHETLYQVGQEVGREVGIEFVYADLRKRYSDSRHRTKGLGLYRQRYCGCLYSEAERYGIIKTD